MTEKVLVAAPTNSRKDYICNEYLRNVTNFTYPFKNYYFVDNSYNIFYHAEKFIDKGFDCDYVNPKGKNNNDYICESQNKIREYFLNSDCTHLFLLEEDLLPPPYIIEDLLSYNTEIAVARYFIGEGKDSHLLHQIMDDTWSPNVNINYSPAGSFLEWGTGQQTNFNYGLGCIMIKKDVMKEIQFRVEDETNHADSFFWLDVNYLEIPFKVHDKLIEHRNLNWTSYSDYRK